MSDSALSTKIHHYLQLEDKKADLEAELQIVLGELRESAGKSTFKCDDQWYQVRTRNGLRYMCKLDGPPRGRPRKAAEPAEVQKES